MIGIDKPIMHSSFNGRFMPRHYGCQQRKGKRKQRVAEADELKQVAKRLNHLSKISRKGAKAQRIGIATKDTKNTKIRRKCIEFLRILVPFVSFVVQFTHSLRLSAFA